MKKKVKKLRTWLKHKNPETRLEYIEARNEAENVKRQAKSNVWRDFGEALEEAVRRNKKKIFGLARSYRKDKIMMYNVKDEDGNIITDENKINDRWQSYFKSLLDRDNRH